MMDIIDALLPFVVGMFLGSMYYQVGKINQRRKNKREWLDWLIAHKAEIPPVVYLKMLVFLAKR